MILVVDMNWKPDSLGYYEFVLPIVEAVKELEQCTVKHYTDVAAADLAQCNRVILSGTALKDNATLGQAEKFGWLKTVEKPVLGICAGMQTIGLVFGLPLVRCIEIGMTEVKTLTPNPLFSDSFRAYSLHNFTVEATGEFEALAESAKCSQALRHKQKQIYGALFHPEVRNTDVLKRFIKLKR
jgi:GMP synthase-like glutamine amidotransferase